MNLNHRILATGIASALALLPAHIHAATYTWDGSTDLWNSLHWNPGLVAGPTNPADTAIINAGMVSFAGNDTFGNAGTTTSPIISLDAGGTLASGGFFNTIWNLNLNGGTVALTGGVNPSYPAFEFAGTLTATGTSNINVVSGGNNVINIGGNGNTTLNMNVVSASDALNVNAPLQNSPFGASSLTKSGNGTLTLSAANTYTGNTTVTAGTLNVTGSCTPSVTTGSGFQANGGLLTFNMGAGTATYYGDGFGTAPQIGFGDTTGTMTVQSGIVNVLTQTGGSFGSINLGVNGASSNGTINVTGGTLNVEGRILMAANGAAGTQATLTIGGGQVNLGKVGSYTTAGDPACGVLWFGAFNSTVNLNGGTLALFGMRTTATGQTQGSFNFNGGTLKAVATNNTDFFALNTGMVAVVKSGGAFIDTNTFAVTIGTALTHDSGLGATPDGGLTKTGNGTLALNVANAYTGPTAVNGGVLAFVGGGTLSAGAAITVGSGATLVFARNDTFGNHAAAVSQTIIVNGGTITNGGNFFTTLGAVALNGGTINSIGGANASFPSFSLKGPVTVVGSAASTISGSGANSQMLVGNITAGTQTTFDVLNATGDNAADLIVSAVLQNNRSVGFVEIATGILKTGAGTMSLTAANTYTGGTTISGGILNVNSDAALGGPAGAVALENGATLQASGDVTTTLRTFTLGSGGGIIDVAATQTVNLDTGSTISESNIGTTLTKSGPGTLRIASVQTYSVLTASQGITNLKSALGTGTSILNADAIVNIGVSQTLSALNIGGGATVTLDSTLAAPALEFGEPFDAEAGGANVAAVPEPGTATLLVGGITALLGLRRRRV